MTMRYPANKILLVITRQIGDVLLATPLLRSLRLAYPQAQIDVLVYSGKEKVLEGNPDYNQVITIDERPRWNQQIALLRQIYHRYDLAVSTLSSDRASFYTILAGRQRVCTVPPHRWQDAWKRKLASAWVELDNWTTHTVIQNLKLADTLEIPRHYEVVIPQQDSDMEKLDELIPFNWRTESYAVLHLVPMWPYKRWTLTGWREVGWYLHRLGLNIVLTGGNDEHEKNYVRVAQLSMPPNTVNMTGQLCFSQLAQLISMSKIYLGPDTAVTHLAAATGTSTIALYGPTNPVKWAPWPYRYVYDNNSPFQKVGNQRLGNISLLQGRADCTPCHQEGCDKHRFSDSRCLQELSSQTVINEINQLLRWKF